MYLTSVSSCDFVIVLAPLDLNIVVLPGTNIYFAPPPPAAATGVPASFASPAILAA
jgi:hypothetical protein